MKIKFLAIVFLFCASMVFAAGKPPKVYSDNWLHIKYCSVKDVLKYKGKDELFLKLKDKFTIKEVKTGVYVFPRERTINPRAKTPSSSFTLSQEHCIVKIDNKDINNVKDFKKWLKYAKGGSKCKVHSVNISLSKGVFSHTRNLPEKPKNYKP